MNLSLEELKQRNAGTDSAEILPTQPPQNPHPCPLTQEKLDNPVPLNDTTRKPQQHTGRKKKLAVGQKEDDHSGHDFEMKM